LPTGEATRMQTRRFIAVVAVLVALWGAPRPASAVLLTFEDLDATNTARNEDGRVIRNGALTSLSATIYGISFTIQRRDGSAFDVIDNTIQRSKAFTALDAPGGPDMLPQGRWGNRSLDPFASFNSSPGAASSPFLITFDTPIHVFSVLLGDYSADTDIINVRAFTTAGGTGAAAFTIVDTLFPQSGSPAPFTQNHFSFATDLDIYAVEIIAGSNTGTGSNRDHMSVYLDRLFFTSYFLPIDQTLIEFLDSKGVFDENAQGHPFVQPGPVVGIPTPQSGAALAVLLPLVLLRRRGVRI
jgi:hypothetical protein